MYSPIAFGKKYDPAGEYIKRYLPILKNYPAKYIYEPWTAPIADQKKWGVRKNRNLLFVFSSLVKQCRIGEDYPKPIVQHDIASKQCIAALKKFFADNKAAASAADDEDEN